MFETLSDRLTSVFKKFSGQKSLTEENVQEGLREVRLALLEADVNFKVVKDFIERVREKCLGQDIIKGLNPAQQVVKIVNDELVGLLGDENTGLELRGRVPYVIMMVGLQGSGKTTSTGKIANILRGRGFKPMLVPADVYRPAAIEQLTTLGKQLDMPVFASTTDMNPVDIAQNAIRAARDTDCNVIILDTAGRLHIDEALMQELVSIKAAVNPQEILFVADAMTGQDAVTVASAFNDALDVTGVVLTKMDGDARGGAALSIKSVTGKSVKFVGMGEKLSDMELFHPDRVAGRILGMGDVMTLIEKAQTTIKDDEAEELSRKMQRAEFNLEDFLTQMHRMRKLGSLDSIMKLLPGMGAIRQKLGNMQVPEKEMQRTEAIINSMTIAERRQPSLLSESRRARVAKGSGTSVQDVNKLIQNFTGMRTMMSAMMGGKKAKKGLQGLMSGKNMPKLPQGMPNMPMGMGGMGGMGMPGMEGMGQASGMSRDDAKKKRDQRKKEKMKKKQGKKKR